MDISNISYFNLAKEVSKYSDHRVKVGCVIVKKKPIGIACNRNKTHPKYANPYKDIRGAIHAEIRAVINSGVDDLDNCSAYVYRETKDGIPAMARPCEFCYKFLKDLGIRKIYYTINEYPFFRMEYVE